MTATSPAETEAVLSIILLPAVWVRLVAAAVASFAAAMIGASVCCWVIASGVGEGAGVPRTSESVPWGSGEIRVPVGCEAR